MIFERVADSELATAMAVSGGVAMGRYGYLTIKSKPLISCRTGFLRFDTL